MAKNPNKTVYSKANFVDAMSERYPNMKMSEIKNFINDFFLVIEDFIIDSNNGDDIKLGNIGVITTKMTKGGERRNPKTQEMVTVQPKRVAKFRSLPKFKAHLNNPTAE